MARLLPGFRVWHMGIICNIDAYTPDDIHVWEFTDTDHINRISLRKFMLGRTYTWVLNYRREMELFGPSVFRSRVDRIRVGMEQYLRDNMKYHLYDFNCEYFVRMCVFNDERLWKSPQTTGVFQSSLFVGLQLAALAVSHMTDFFIGELDYEADSADRKDDTRYAVTGDIIEQR